MGLVLLAACVAAWPIAASAEILQVDIHDYFVHVGDPRADYFHGALLTENDLNEEQTYKRSSNRYIGETEKDLAELFLPAGHGDVVLFFDEADALLDKRTDVKDSHDRYADDFIVLDPQDGTWRGRLYLEEWGDIVAGVYDDLSGRFQDFVLVREPAPLAPIGLGLALAGLALAKRKRAA